MNDMSSVIVPKSDQINADSLIAGPMTVTIKAVIISAGQEQPVSIALEETPLFYRPCKSMSRVLVSAWGADASKYVGRSLTLYRDPEVKWGGLAVGGIRISHLSHLDGAKTMVLTATKGSRKPHKVLPLEVKSAPAKEDAASKWANAYIAKLPTFTEASALEGFVAERSKKLAELQGVRPELAATVEAALAARRAELSGGGFEDDLTSATPTSEDPLRTTLRRIEDAKTLDQVQAIEAETENDRAFLTDEQVERLDECLATRRSELRATEQAEA